MVDLRWYKFFIKKIFVSFIDNLAVKISFPLNKKGKIEDEDRRKRKERRE
ncbi:MAG: hypothetical protein K0R25_1261 [Rickettsiaceae bacterium]|jgi:hypothetical protein|nr:hypothetical protein [Rickettsiaceae bacterium]